MLIRPTRYLLARIKIKLIWILRFRIIFLEALLRHHHGLTSFGRLLIVQFADCHKIEYHIMLYAIKGVTFFVFNIGNLQFRWTWQQEYLPERHCSIHA